MALDPDLEPDEGDIVLEDPIKIRWTGYARGRISEYNASYEEEDEDSTISPKRFLRAVNRQKTNIVIRTVEEADAVYAELRAYDSGQRTWMNHAMDRSISRVQREIVSRMEQRGYVAVRGRRIYGIRTFRGFRKETI